MKEPIKAGDMAEVINGMTGKASPNIGLIVTVKMLVYECPQLGKIWRCEAEYAETIRNGKCDCPPGMGDFAQDWLRKINPPDGLKKTTNATEELTA
jgi:predicted RNA-binding Zn-ribbon protein involved in translation (DUF1610 family)